MGSVSWPSCYTQVLLLMLGSVPVRTVANVVILQRSNGGLASRVFSLDYLDVERLTRHRRTGDETQWTRGYAMAWVRATILHGQTTVRWVGVHA